LQKRAVSAHVDSSEGVLRTMTTFTPLSAANFGVLVGLAVVPLMLLRG
jgi:hypothetical protein